MPPFRNSLSARLLSIAATILFTGGGVSMLAGVDPNIAIPLTLLATIGCSIFAIILGIEDYTQQVALSALTLPVGLWPYVMFMAYMGAGHAQLAWIPTLLGLAPLAMTLVASRLGGGEKAPTTAATPGSA